MSACTTSRSTFCNNHTLVSPSHLHDPPLRTTLSHPPTFPHSEELQAILDRITEATPNELAVLIQARFKAVSDDGGGGVRGGGGGGGAGIGGVGRFGGESGGGCGMSEAELMDACEVSSFL